MLKKISLLLYEWDPICLKEANVPFDEYLPEAEMIISMLNDKRNSIELADIIYNIFKDQFGDATISFNKKDCLNVSNLILTAYRTSNDINSNEII